MITHVQRERLRQFFAGNFHQDWDIDVDGPDGVIAAFIRGKTRQELSILGEALVTFIQEHPTDKDLDDSLFRKLGCYYIPSLVGIPTRSWLLELASRLADGA